jgi:hypothetical protein
VVLAETMPDRNLEVRRTLIARVLDYDQAVTLGRPGTLGSLCCLSWSSPAITECR